jgi:hypothetical protein
MDSTTVSPIQPHNERPVAVWSSRPGAAIALRLGRIERVRELLGDAFQLRFERAMSYYREPSAAAAWSTFSTGYGPTKSLAMSLDPNRLAEFRDDFIAFHETFAMELGICVPREYLLTVGVR